MYYTMFVLAYIKIETKDKFQLQQTGRLYALPYLVIWSILLLVHELSRYLEVVVAVFVVSLLLLISCVSHDFLVILVALLLLTLPHHRGNDVTSACNFLLPLRS